MLVSERWTAQKADPEPLSFLERGGEAPFALLYGGGELGRFTIFAREALGRWSSPPAPGELGFERQGELPPFFPDLLGLASYEWGVAQEALVPPALEAAIPIPGYSFCLYRELAIHDRVSGILYEGQREILAPGHSPAFRPAREERNLLRGGRFSAAFARGTEDAASYAAKVEGIRERIAAGEVYQVNLTRQEEWDFSGDLRDYARALWRLNPAPFSAFIAEPGFTVVSSSPERLVRLEAGWLEARPIKGTAPRSAEPEADRALAEGLLASGKDRAELAMIVDLVRNDLAGCCAPGSTEVAGFPILESYANVHHLVASVRGRYDPGRGLRGLLAALFPGGSITGCPKIAAMKAIREIEDWPRSVYTGSIGWLSADLSALDLNIAIRTVWADEKRLRFGVGGAVVWDSDPAGEYLETIHKARSIVACLNSAKAPR
jgi:anthranilate/para-aminobenzoate synthase component I